MIRRLVLFCCTASLATAAAAQEAEPRFCPNRPSLGSSACTTLPGQVQFEASAVDWERDSTSDERQDTVLLGDFQARFGVGPATEVQLSWTPYAHNRTRDRLAGGIERTGDVGDVRLGLRQNFRNPDGEGLSFGAEPFVTLPVGRTPVGAGDWGAGVVVPVTYALGDKAELGFTGEADAAVDGDGDGRHFAASGIVTFSYDLTDKLTGTVEAQLLRDQDPANHATQAFAAGGFSFNPTKTRQLFVYAIGGLNHDTPDLRLLTGFSTLF